MKKLLRYILLLIAVPVMAQHQSPYTSETYKTCVFRETFNNPFEVRENGGTISGVTFEDGLSYYSVPSGIYYNNLKLNGTYSIRIKATLEDFSASQYLLDFRGTNINGSGYLYITTEGINAAPNGTKYTNGELSESVVSGEEVEIVVSGMTIISGTGTNIHSVGWRINGTTGLNGSIDLVEIYQGTLSATEVANLYAETRYSQPVLDPILHITAERGIIENTEFTGNLLTGINLLEGYDFTNPVWADWIGGTDVSANSFISDADGGGLVYIGLLTIGKKYRLHVAGSITGGAFSAGGASVTGYLPLSSATPFDRTIEFIAKDITQFGVYNSGNAQTTTLTTFELYEVEKDLTNTATTVVRDGDIWVMDFNGSTSLLDLNTYLNTTLASDLTIISWVKVRTNGETGYGNILNNGKIFYELGNSTTYRLSRNGDVNGATSAVGAVTYNKYQCVIVTSTSAGVTNIYVDGVLSGTANQNAGTPAAGNQKLTIGNYYNGVLAFDGKIGVVIVDTSIWTPAQISQYYTSTKYKYGK